MGARGQLASRRTIAERWFGHGRQLALGGDYEEALEPLERALAYSVDETDLGFLARIRSWLGVTVAMTGGNTLRARNLCEEAIYVLPRDPELYVNLARVLIQSERRELAMACVETTLALDPENAAAASMVRQFGQRKSPTVPFLNRKNPINKYVGLLRQRFDK